MPSSFAWLATDQSQRQRMMELVDQFRDESTIDDLGLGRIRDAWAARLFPGTSTLHTRVRYVLFTLWLMREAERQDTVDDMLRDLREREFRLIPALQAGMSNRTGIIGNDAGRRLRRTPADVYWGMAVAWGLVAPRATPRKHFERVLLDRDLSRRPITVDEIDRPAPFIGHGLVDARLPPEPPGLLQAASFGLRRGEAEYLQERISTAHHDSLLGHLVEFPPASWRERTELSSSLPALLEDDLPRELQAVLRSALRFAVLAQTANLTYNVFLAEARDTLGLADDDSLARRHRDRLSAVFDEYRTDEAFDTAELARLSRPGHVPFRLHEDERRFIAGWAALLSQHKDAEDLVDAAEARDMIRRRERQKKGRLARLSHPERLDAWSGASGVRRMDFRWSTTALHLKDIYEGLVMP